MKFSLPPIVKLAERLLVEIENAVRRWPRYHKYHLGSDLRQIALTIAKVASRAARDQESRTRLVSELVWQADEMRIALELGCALKAFASRGQFESLLQVTLDLASQAGGWNRQLQAKHRKDQNSSAAPSAAERVQILSTRTASIAEARS